MPSTEQPQPISDSDSGIEIIHCGDTDPDDVDEVANRNGPSTEGIQEDGEVQTCKPMVKAHVLRRIFHEQFQSLQATEEDSDNEGASRPLPAYQMTRTKLITRETGHSGLKQFVHQVLELLKLRNTWMVRTHYHLCRP